MTFVSVLAAAEPTMNPDDRGEVLKLLHDSRQELLDSISGLSEAQWNWKAAPGRWSIAETAEHILLTEGGHHCANSRCARHSSRRRLGYENQQEDRDPQEIPGEPRDQGESAGIDSAPWQHRP